MPIKDGYQAASAIRAGEAGAQASNIPIVAMTANAMEGDKQKCLGAGMDDYISKPIDATLLSTALIEWSPIEVRSPHSN